MIDSGHLLTSILDRLLQLLPAEPATIKRLDDIVDADAGVEEPEILEAESAYPESGVHATVPLQAAS